jgi:hypothetical protein
MLGQFVRGNRRIFRWVPCLSFRMLRPSPRACPSSRPYYPAVRGSTAGIWHLGSKGSWDVYLFFDPACKVHRVLIESRSKNVGSLPHGSRRSTSKEDFDLALRRKRGTGCFNSRHVAARNTVAEQIHDTSRGNPRIGEKSVVVNRVRRIRSVSEI